MFLAIAVDNLANAQELSEAEAEAAEEEEKVTPYSISHNATLFDNKRLFPIFPYCITLDRKILFPTKP